MVVADSEGGTLTVRPLRSLRPRADSQFDMQLGSHPIGLLRALRPRHRFCRYVYIIFFRYFCGSVSDATRKFPGGGLGRQPPPWSKSALGHEQTFYGTVRVPRDTENRPLILQAGLFGIGSGHHDWLPSQIVFSFLPTMLYANVIVSLAGRLGVGLYAGPLKIVTFFAAISSLHRPERGRADDKRQ